MVPSAEWEKLIGWTCKASRRVETFRHIPLRPLLAVMMEDDCLKML